MIVGAHVSIAGGISKSIVRGEAIGVNFIQSFASSPRTMKFTQIDDSELQRYLEYKEASNIQGHVFHGVYLINLAHENLGYVRVCVDSLKYYQKLASQIEALGTVFHIGSHKGRGLEAVIDQVALSLGHVLDSMSEEVWLLLENTAGQNGAIGQSLAELALIIDTVTEKGHDTRHLGICIDSQHMFAGGVDLRREGAIDQLVDDIEAHIGLEKLRLIHVNDSLTEYASRRDRHANVGEGKLGNDAIARMINHPKLTHLPFVLEVPGANKSGPRMEDVDQLIKLRQA